MERARGESGVPFLDRREHGAIELRIVRGAVQVRTERCVSGVLCELELPPPSIRSLSP
jgi:hypothetical protein